jgi:hypothetical protein
MSHGREQRAVDASTFDTVGIPLPIVGGTVWMCPYHTEFDWFFSDPSAANTNTLERQRAVCRTRTFLATCAKNKTEDERQNIAEQSTCTNKLRPSSKRLCCARIGVCRCCRGGWEPSGPRLLDWMLNALFATRASFVRLVVGVLKSPSSLQEIFSQITREKATGMLVHVATLDVRKPKFEMLCFS